MICFLLVFRPRIVKWQMPRHEKNISEYFPLNMKCSKIFLCPEDRTGTWCFTRHCYQIFRLTYIVLFLRLPVEEDHLAVVPAPVLLLDVGQVEAGCSQPLPVAGLHLGDPAVVGLRVQEVVGAVCGVVVVPGEQRKMLLLLSIILLSVQSDPAVVPDSWPESNGGIPGGQTEPLRTENWELTIWILEYRCLSSPTAPRRGRPRHWESWRGSWSEPSGRGWQWCARDHYFCSPELNQAIYS